MKIAIIQPYFLPYLGYFQIINAVDRFVAYDDVNFMKKKWINRNNILIAGQPNFFVVPLKKISQNKLIKDIEIALDLNWKSKILKKVETAYRKAPYFQKAFDLFENIVNQNHTQISELAFESISAICNYLNISTQLIPSSTIYKNSHLKNQDRIIDICVKENADHYINPIGGIELYSKESFLNYRIRLNFLKSEQISYRQFKHTFVPHLSTLDIIMFNDVETIHSFLKRFQLI
jgi:hypothetical protein